MTVKVFVTSGLIFNIFAIFALRGQAVSQYCETGGAEEIVLDRCLLGKEIDGSLEFIQALYSKKNFKSEIALLEDLEALQDEFADCNNPRKRLIVANKAIGALRQLAKSEEILKDKNLSAKFEVFLKKFLISFKFDQKAIRNFILGLSLDSKLRLGYLKVKSGCQIGVKSAVCFLVVLVAIVKIFKFVVICRHFFKGNDEEQTDCEFCICLMRNILVWLRDSNCLFKF